MRGPVYSPDDRTVADLCLAADGLLGDHLAGSALTGPARPSRTARLAVPAEVAEAALAAGVLEIADAESMPVAHVAELTPSAERKEQDEQPDGTVILSGTVTPAREATGVGQQLRVSRTALPTSAHQQVVVLARPPLPGELDKAGEPDTDLVLAVPIAGPSPQGLPAAALLRLAQAEADRLRNPRRVEVRTVTVAWRDPASDQQLAAAVAAGLGGQLNLLAGSDHEWGALLDLLEHDPDCLPARAGSPLAAELLRWRPPRATRGLVVFFTGLSGAGKSTLARGLADHLATTGERTVTLLDGDEVRRLLSAGLGFGAEGRDQNVRRIGYVAAEVARHGGVAICAPIAPYQRSRAAARSMVEHAGGDFVLVHVATSLADCEARDVKGLYARARAGEIAEFTGISDPYEVPVDPELRVETAGRTVEQATADVVAYLRHQGWLTQHPRTS